MTLQLVKTFQPHASRISTLAAFASGKHAVSAGEDGSLVFWEVANNERCREFPVQENPITQLATFPNGEFLVSGNRSGEVLIWNSETTEIVRHIAGHTCPITALAVSENGELICTGGQDSSLHVYDSSTGRMLYVWSANHAPVTAAVFLENGPLIIAVGSPACEIQVWDLQRGSPLRAFGSDCDTHSLTPGTDSRWLLSGTGSGYMRMWDWTTGKALRTIQTPYKHMHMRAIPRSEHVILAGEDPTLSLWHVPSGEITQQLEQPVGPVDVVDVTRDGRRVLVGCANGFIHIYDQTAT